MKQRLHYGAAAALSLLRIAVFLMMLVELWWGVMAGSSQNLPGVAIHALRGALLIVACYFVDSEWHRLSYTYYQTYKPEELEDPE